MSPWNRKSPDSVEPARRAMLQIRSRFPNHAERLRMLGRHALRPCGIILLVGVVRELGNRGYGERDVGFREATSLHSIEVRKPGARIATSLEDVESSACGVG